MTLGSLRRTFDGPSLGDFLAAQARDLGLLTVLAVGLVVATRHSESKGPVAWALLGVLVVIFLFRVARRALMSERLELFEHGLRFTRGRERPRELRFSDVASLQTAFIETHHERGAANDSWVLVRGMDGTEIELTPAVGGLAGLADALAESTLPYLGPRAIARIEAGEEIDFGVLHASRDGLRLGNDRVAWVDLGHLGLAAGKVRLRSKADPRHELAAPLGSVANWHVLLHLATRYA